MKPSYEVVIVGGGAAGLSAGVALARFRRSVLLVDAGAPRNAAAGHVHNFLTRDGASPAELYATGRAEFTGYGGEVVDGRVTAVRRDGDGFVVSLADTEVTARRMIFATGSRDELPDVPGVRERWGAEVLHCPFCHGWEVRDQHVGVLATSAAALHQVQLFRQLTEHVTLLRHIAPELSAEQAELLAALDVPVVDGEVVQVEAGELAVRLADGDRLALDALVVAPLVRGNDELLTPLGAATADVRMGGTPDGALLATQVEADPMGLAAPGVWVAGNLGNAMAQVVSSAAAGLTAASAVVADLMAADTAAALQVHGMHSRAAWDERYSSSGHAHLFSGEPNAALVTEVAGLTPGRAFDAGAGEGGDAVWLARQGWTVTAADHSDVALQRARAAAEQAGVEVDWQVLDLATDPLPDAGFDLVTSAFLHLPRPRRREAFARLAAAVAPGGTLVVLGHDPSDEHSGMPRPGLRELGWTADELAASLGDDWTVVTCEARTRRTRHPDDGREITISDAVLRAVRDA